MITGQNEMGGNVNPIHFLMEDIWEPLQEVPEIKPLHSGPRVPRYSRLVESITQHIERLHTMKRTYVDGVKRFRQEGVVIEYAYIGRAYETEVIVIETSELSLKICFKKRVFHFVWNSRLQHMCRTLNEHESRAAYALLRGVKEII